MIRLSVLRELCELGCPRVDIEKPTLHWHPLALLCCGKGCPWACKMIPTLRLQALSCAFFDPGIKLSRV